MNAKKLIGSALLLGSVLLVLLFLHRLKRTPLVASMLVFYAPIELYGKVVDQHGNPVEGATVKIAPFDTPGEDVRKRLTMMSNGKGEFSVKGLRGMSLSVNVVKEGYVTYSFFEPSRPYSSRLLSYGLSSTGGKEYKDPANPVIFTLHEIGPVEPMIFSRYNSWSLPLDGTPRTIALGSEDGEGSHQIEFRFKSDRSSMVDPIYDRKYDWSLEISIPGGGLVRGIDDYQFEAPADGYQESVKIEYTASMSEGEWRRSTGRHFFVRFADGTHGRIKISISGGAVRGQLGMSSWLNPKPGSRNLASEQMVYWGYSE